MKIRAGLLCAVLLVAAIPLLAQNAPATQPLPPPVDRLPADTWVVVTWHGSASFAKVRATNPLLRLWDDPQSLAARERLVKLFSEMGDDKEKTVAEKMSREEVQDLISILENPFTAGVAGHPFAAMKSGAPAKPGFFVVFNRRGKEALVEKLNKKEKSKPNQEKSTFTFSGVEVRKTVTTTIPEKKKEEAPDPDAAGEEEQPEAAPEPKIETSFEATLGDYEVYSDEQPVIESLITRLKASGPATDSLLTNKTYQAAQRLRSPGAMLDAFVLIPDLSGAPIPPNPNFDFAAMLRELHLERVQAFALSAAMAPDRAVARTALLGDTTPGSLFDFAGSNVAEFRTLAAAPASGSYGAFRIDLAALYATLKRAAKAGLPPEQAAMADMLDGLVAMQTGIPLDELLALFTGEIGTVSTGQDQLAEVLPDLVMVPVTKAEPVLGLLRTLLASRISGEEQLAGATVLTMTPAAPVAAEGEAPAPAPKPFYVAVGPTLLVVSPTKQQVTETLARAAAAAPTGAAAPGGSLAADPGFQRVRKTLPKELIGMSYADMSRYPWEQAHKTFREQFEKARRDALEKAAAAMKGDEENPPDAKQAEEHRKSAEQAEEMAKILDTLVPLLKRYLHTSVGAWWKAADGIFMESYVN